LAVKTRGWTFTSKISAMLGTQTKRPRTGIPGSGASVSAHESHVSIIYDYRKILNIKTSIKPTAHAIVDVMEYVMIWSFTSPTPRVLFTTQK
jgi:hypothetical protein